MKVSTEPADVLVMVVLQPLVIAFNLVLILWALRTVDEIDRAES